MKTVKITDIESFELDMTMYTEFNAKNMLDNNSDIFYVNDSYDVTSDSDSYKGEPLRINYSACVEIKVVYKKDYDLYMTIVKTHDGSIYYIKL
jgi:hypothetical protein